MVYQYNVFNCHETIVSCSLNGVKREKNNYKNAASLFMLKFKIVAFVTLNGTKMQFGYLKQFAR